MTATTTPVMTTITTTAMNDSFDRFGDDLAELLLQYLPIDDRLRLQSVSKQFRQLFSTIFTAETDLIFDSKLMKRLTDNSLLDSRYNNNNDYKSVDSLKVFELLIKKCPNITTLTINDMYFHYLYFELLMTNCSRLRHLSIRISHNLQRFSSSSSKQFDDFFNQFGQQLLTLKFHRYDRYISRQQINNAIDLMTNLKTLQITDKYDFNIQLSDILTAYKSYILPKSLNSLTVKVNPQSLPLFAKFTDTYGQQIRSLHLSCHSFEICNYQSLITGFEQLKQLTKLTIDLFTNFGDNKFTGKLLASICRNCRQLSSLTFKLVMPTKKIAEMFAEINEHISPKLRQLSLECLCNYYADDYTITELTGDSLNRLHRLTHLSLRLHQPQYIGDQFFGDIHLNHPRLQSIYCDTVFITDRSILAMGQLAHLQSVDIRCYVDKLTTSESFLINHLLMGTKVKHLYLQYNDCILGIRVLKCGKYLISDDNCID